MQCGTGTHGGDLLAGPGPEVLPKASPSPQPQAGQEGSLGIMAAGPAPCVPAEQGSSGEWEWGPMARCQHLGVPRWVTHAPVPGM